MKFNVNIDIKFERGVAKHDTLWFSKHLEKLYRQDNYMAEVLIDEEEPWDTFVRVHLWDDQCQSTTALRDTAIKIYNKALQEMEKYDHYSYLFWRKEEQDK